jgi:hypothetical protein
VTSRRRGICMAIGLMVGLGFGARAQAPRSDGKPTSARQSGAVAVVGGVRLSWASFDQRVREAEASYRQRANTPPPAELHAVIRRLALEGLIREQLLNLEARRRGMALTPEQAEEELKKDPFFRPQGTFDQAKYLAVKSTQPEQFRQALEQVRTALPALRLRDQLERQNRPDETRLREEIERKLSTVTIDFLALRWAAFSAERPQPSEREVLAYYQAHADEYQRPEEVVMTLVSVNRPSMPVAEQSSSAAVQAWETRMRERADSLLRALKGGARLEDLAPSFGEVRKGVTAERDRFPDDWRGSARARQAVFSLAPGRFLDEPVPGRPGFIVTRVDEQRPRRTASLREVAGVVRHTLQEQIVRRLDDGELRALYDASRESFRGPAYRVRFAVADTGQVRVQEPTAAELDRYYRGHLADYSFFDPKTSSIGSRSFSDVQAEIRGRLLQERRTAAARDAAERLLAVWKSGKRDPKLERAMTTMREVGPVTVGSLVDTSLAGQVLTDSLASRPGLRVDWARFPRGWVVYHAFAEQKGYLPSFEEARPLLARKLEPARQEREESEAHRFFDQNPERFEAARIVRFSRVMVEPPAVEAVQITRAEVEQFYRRTMSDYGAPELTHVRHILVTPKDASPPADAAARREAEDLMGRIRAGESFVDLAREHSDDESTRENGGDLGVIRRGTMLEEFERTAFDMEKGDLRGPVKTEAGYHVIECLEHAPAEVTPLKYAYPNVAKALAREKADRIAKSRADSLRRACKTPSEARRAAQKLGLEVNQNVHVVGTTGGRPEIKAHLLRLESLKPGRLDPEIQEYKGVGYAVSWVDTVLTGQRPGWDVARDQALSAYRRQLQQREALKKRAELDSLAAAGWSLDSLAALFGGLERHGPKGSGAGLERLAGSARLDSLAFGTSSAPPVLQPGKASGWVEFPGGWARLRLVERKGPEPVQSASRFEIETRAALERNLRTAYEKLKQRFPVEILDPELRHTELPPIPES